MPIQVPDEKQDLLGRIKTDLLYQPFLEKLNALVNNCIAKGVYYFATSGFRSWEEQDKLYAIGRTVGKIGHVVTKARGGYSPHNHGVAVDFCYDTNPDKPGLQPDYTIKNFNVLAEEATKLGLEAGHYWKFQDSPHIQLNLKSRGVTWDMLRSAFRGGGMPAVFALLDSKGPW